jgi:poly-beta-hydroxyalkanoate depolymerase
MARARVNPRFIRRTALFTVEGERDDICTAQELCSSLRPYMKRHHVQTGVGHYGVFNGQRWRGYIYPILTNVICRERLSISAAGARPFRGPASDECNSDERLKTRHLAGDDPLLVL